LDIPSVPEAQADRVRQFLGVERRVERPPEPGMGREFNRRATDIPYPAGQPEPTPQPAQAEVPSVAVPPASEEVPSAPAKQPQEMTRKDLVPATGDARQRFKKSEFRGEMYDANGDFIGNVYRQGGKAYVVAVEDGKIVGELPGPLDPKSFQKIGRTQLSENQAVDKWAFKPTPQPEAVSQGETGIRPTMGRTESINSGLGTPPESASRGAGLAEFKETGTGLVADVKRIADEAGLDYDESYELWIATSEHQGDPTGAFSTLYRYNKAVAEKLEKSGFKEQYLDAVRGGPRAAVVEDDEGPTVAEEGPFGSRVAARGFAEAEVGVGWRIEQRADGYHVVMDESQPMGEMASLAAEAPVEAADALIDEGAKGEGFAVPEAPAQAPAVEEKLGRDPHSYMTPEEERVGYPKAREVVRRMSDDELKSSRASSLRDSFDPMFGHNATSILRIFDEEVARRRGKSKSRPAGFTAEVARLKAEHDARVQSVRAQVGPEGGEIDLGRGETAIISRNPDKATAAESPWRVTRLRDGQPIGHTVHKALDQEGAGPYYSGAVQEVAGNLAGRREAAPAPAAPVTPTGQPVLPVAPGQATGYAMVRPSEMRRDAARMQYRQDADATGVTSTLRDVTEIKPESLGQLLVWRDPETNEIIVADGHQRHALAERLGYNEPIPVRFLEGKNAADIRVQAALVNIRAGHGTAVDAAKLIRDLRLADGDIKGYLKSQGVPLTNAVAKGGAALADLAQSIFDRVATGRLSLAHGVAIGEAGLSHEQQIALLKMPKAESMTAAQLGELARFVRAAGSEAVQQETLFGTETFDVALAPEKAKLSAWVKQKLGRDRRLMRVVGDPTRAARLAELQVATVSVDKAAELGTEAAQAEELFHRLSTRTGPVADALNDAARRITKGEKKSDVQQDLYQAVHEAIVQSLQAPVSRSVEAGRDTGEGGGARPAPVLDTDLFGETVRPERPEQVAAAPAEAVAPEPTPEQRLARIKAMPPAERNPDDVEWANNYTRQQAKAKGEQAKAASTAVDDPFFAGMDAKTKARAEKALSTNMTQGGEVKTRKQIVDEMVAAGAQVQEHPKYGRILQKPDGAFVEETRLTKTAMNYAVDRIARKGREAPVTAEAPGTEAPLAMTGQAKFDMINAALDAGQTVYLGTPLRVTPITPKVRAQFAAKGRPVVKVSASGGLRVIEGGKYVSADYVSIRVEGEARPAAKPKSAKVVAPAPPVAAEAAPAEAPAAPSPAPVESPKLPTRLSGAKPRYGYRDRQFTLTFESDMDRALYIVAQTTPSKKDAEYMNWLRQQMPGAVTADIRAVGAAVRARIKALAVATEGDEIVVPTINRPGEEPAPASTPKPAPAAKKPAAKRPAALRPETPNEIALYSGSEEKVRAELARHEEYLESGLDEEDTKIAKRTVALLTQRVAEIEAAKAAPAPPAFGTTNTIVTADRAAELKAKLAKKLNQLNVGLDPEQVSAGAELTVYYIEGGVRKFVDVANRLATDLGVKVGRLKPYLKQWYNDARAALAKAGQNVADLDTPEQVDAAVEGLAAEPEPAPRIVSLRKADSEEIRAGLDLPPLPEPMRRPWQQAWDDAIEQNLASAALEIARQSAATMRALSTTEHAALLQRFAQLEKERDDAKAVMEEATSAGNEVVALREAERLSRIREEMGEITLARAETGTVAGQDLAALKMRADVDAFSLVHGLELRTRSEGRKLTPPEVAVIEEITERLQKSEKLVAELTAENDRLNDERERQIAEAVAKAEAAKARVGRKDKSYVAKLKAERVDLLKQLTTLGIRLNNVTGVPAEGLAIIGKLAVNHIRTAQAERAGEVTLDSIIKDVLVEINNPAISERDVRDALAGRSPKRQRKAKTDADRMVQELKAQARLLAKIEDAENGVFDAKRTKGQQSQAVRDLKARLTALRTAAYRTVKTGEQLERVLKTITELQNQLDGHYRNIKAKKATPETTAQLEEMKEKVRALRQEMRVQDQIADLEEQLRTGDFKKPEKREPKPVSPALEREQIRLRKLKREWRIKTKAKERRSFGRFLMGTARFYRTLKAFLDASFTLRQMAGITGRRPIKAVESFARAQRAMVSPDYADRVDNLIRNRPYYLIGDRAGLDLTDFGGVVGEHEEMFDSAIAERLPVVGIGVRASDRSATTTSNLMRSDAFDGFVDRYPNATSAELKAWADVINTFSGRGDLGRFTAAADILGFGLWSPRLAVSRFQTPYMMVKYWQMPRVRKEIAKELGADLWMASTVLILATLGGYATGIDPRDPDFGKIRIGDTRFDIFAGILQPIRLMARIVLGATDRAGITGKFTPDAMKDIDPLELVWQFASYKLSPIVTMPVELYRGKNVMGQPIAPSETLIRAHVPFMLESIWDAYHEPGREWYDFGGKNMDAAPGVVGANYLGVGAQNYPDSPLRTRFRIESLVLQGKQSEAWAMVDEWNKTHPDVPGRDDHIASVKGLRSRGPEAPPPPSPPRAPRAPR
jgi:hypothetical protein